MGSREWGREEGSRRSRRARRGIEEKSERGGIRGKRRTQRNQRGQRDAEAEKRGVGKRRVQHRGTEKRLNAEAAEAAEGKRREEEEEEKEEHGHEDVSVARGEKPPNGQIATWPNEEGKKSGDVEGDIDGAWVVDEEGVGAERGPTQIVVKAGRARVWPRHPAEGGGEERNGEEKRLKSAVAGARGVADGGGWTGVCWDG